MTDKSKALAQEYVAEIEHAAGEGMDVDLARIVRNAYETAYLRGSTDAIEDYLEKDVAQLNEMRAHGDAVEAEMRAHVEAIEAEYTAAIDAMRARVEAVEALLAQDKPKRPLPS